MISFFENPNFLHVIYIYILKMKKPAALKDQERGIYEMKEKDTYEELVQYIIENNDKFYRIAYTYMGNKDNSLDCVQSAICKALEYSSTLKNIKAVKTWFYKILVNECLQYLRKSKREIISDPFEIIEDSCTEKGYEEIEIATGSDVFHLVEKLPLEQKTIIILRYYEELSLKEIARITETNENTVKSRLYSAIVKLQKNVKEAAI